MSLSFSDAEMKQMYASTLPESSTEERSRASAASAATIIASKKRRNAKRKQQQHPPSVPGADDDDNDDPDIGFSRSADSADAPAAAAGADLAPFRIESMKTFASQFPHLNMSSQCELAIAKLDVAKVALSKTLANRLRRKAAESPSSVDNHADQETLATLSEYKKDLSKVQSRRLHYDQSQHIPAEVELLHAARAQLAVPQFTHGEHMLAHTEASEMLRRKYFRLPVYTAAHETQLMAQHAGTWTIEGFGERTFPPCCFGKECIGFKEVGLIPGLTERVVFMRAMSPEEWQNLALRGVQPVGTSPCILDGRLRTVRYVAKERLALRPGHTMQRDGPEAVFQLWRNLVGSEGGYWPRYIFVPAENEILIEPIVAFTRSTLHATRLPNGMWSVSQDTMVWKPPALMERTLGESAQDFCAGADSNKKPMLSSSRDPSASAPRSLTLAAVCSDSGSCAKEKEN